MSFDQEWAQHKQNASEQNSTQMQLNQLPSDPGGGGGGSEPGVLKASQKDLAAVGDEAYKLRGRLTKDADHARTSTLAAESSLTGDFALAGALGDIVSAWVDQTRTLLDACGHISNHLDYTKKAHASGEEYVVTLFSKVSELDKGFDESTRPQPGQGKGDNGGMG